MVMALSRNILLILTSSIIWVLGIYPQDIINSESYYLQNFKFISILGDCYQLYHKNNVISPCRREPDSHNQACIQRILNTCIGLTTPTNETVVFRCASQIRFDNCYEVYDINNKVNIVCQQSIGGHSVGITTPDNFTIILYNCLCRSATNSMERQVHSNFVNGFSLDAGARSCYKVYNQKQIVSPYNCLSEDVFNACVFSVANGCTALRTENNEVLILDCPDRSLKPEKDSCYYLYSTDNQVHILCQQKLEERCVGIVTPSNLTVLFECFFCAEQNELTYYNIERQRNYRNFVKNYLENQNPNTNLRLKKFVYKVYNKNYNLESINYLAAFWVPSTSCLGLKLETNETIILECMVKDDEFEYQACFKLISPNNETQSICAQVLNEACVAVTTPYNITVTLACYADNNGDTTRRNSNTIAYKSRLEADRMENIFRILNYFINDRFEFKIGESYIMEKHETANQSSVITYVQKIDDYEDCIGILTETETVVLNCAGVDTQKKKGCFNVIKRRNGVKRYLSRSENKVGNVCVTVLNEYCVGIITPDGWILQFTCIENNRDRLSIEYSVISAPTIYPPRERRGL